MTPDNYTILASNIMQLSLNRELGPYELALYQQLLMTLRTGARYDELILRDKIEDIQYGKGSDQTPGGTSSQVTETEEHRGDDSSPTV